MKMFFFSIMLLTGYAACAQNRAAAIDSLLQEAYSLYDSKEYGQSLALCKKAAAADSTVAEVYCCMGRAYAAIRRYGTDTVLIFDGLPQYDSAMICYRKALDIDSLYAPAYNNIGIHYADLEKHDSARIYYLKAISSNPDYYLAYYNMGVSRLKQEKYELAVLWLEKTLDFFEEPGWLEEYTLDIAKAKYHYEKGEAYEQTGNLKKAVREWRKATPHLVEAERKLEHYGRLREIDKLGLKPTKEIIKSLAPIVAGLIAVIVGAIWLFRRLRKII